MTRITRIGGSGITWPYANLQAGIDATATGATLLVPPGLTFAEQVAIPRAMTILAPDGNSTITGSGVRSVWADVNASGVTIDGIDMVNAAAGAVQSGSLNFTGARTGFRLNNCKLSGGSYANLRLWTGPSDIIVTDCDFSFGRCLGAITYDVDDLHFVGCRFFNNNTDHFNVGNEAGGIKFALGTTFTFDNCDAYDNDGPGFWADVAANGLTIFGSRSYRNTRPGIMFEICNTASIHDNVIWRNGATQTPFAGGGGIYISSSRIVEVYNNLCAYNAQQIVVSSQDRYTAGDPAPATPEWDDVQQISIHDNDMIALSGQKLLQWVQDFGGVLFSAGNNTGNLNRYWHASTEPTPSDRFAWNGNISTLSSFNATPGEQSATYMSDATKNALIAANGIS